MFTETDPDKGTKTLKDKYNKDNRGIQFTETDPDKGTKTLSISIVTVNCFSALPFTETDPDKGTKTFGRQRYS